MGRDDVEKGVVDHLQVLVGGTLEGELVAHIAAGGGNGLGVLALGAGLALGRDPHVLGDVLAELGARGHGLAGVGQALGLDVRDGELHVHGIAEHLPRRVGLAAGVGRGRERPGQHQADHGGRKGEQATHHL